MAYRWNPGFGDIQFNGNLANQGFTAAGFPALPSGSPSPGYTWLLTPSGRTGQVLTQTLINMGWGFSAYPQFYDPSGTIFFARENQFDVWTSPTPVQSGVHVPTNWTGSTPANPANTPPPTSNVVTSSGVPPLSDVRLQALNSGTSQTTAASTGFSLSSIPWWAWVGVAGVGIWMMSKT